MLTEAIKGSIEGISTVFLVNKL